MLVAMCLPVVTVYHREQPLAMQLVTEVMYKLRNHETAWPWLRELMGQSHLSSADNKVG